MSGKVLLGALLKSMARSEVEADVAMPGGTLFSKMSDLKAIVTLQVLHIRGIGDDFGIREWWCSRQ